MDSTYALGLLLVGLSAVLLAAHWQSWRQPQPHRSQRWQKYAAHQVRRRTVASSLIGLVGAALMACETVPPTPLSITSYLLALVLATCWILWLACLDFWASRRFQEDQQLDQLAAQLHSAQQTAIATDSQESP